VDEPAMRAGDPRGELRRAAQRESGNAMAWIVLSEAELDAGDVAAGEAAALRALALQPGHPEALARLGRAQWMSNRRREAVASLQAAARNAPRHPGIAVWLGHVLEDVGEAEAAADAYARAHALLPEDAQIAAYLLAWRRKICDWRDLDALSRQVRAAVAAGRAAVEPFAFLSEDASAAEQLRCARLRAADIAHAVRPLPAAKSKSPLPPFFKGGKAETDEARLASLAGSKQGARQPDLDGLESVANPPFEKGGPGAICSQIRIGFLSNGFGAHPTGLLTVALFEALRSQAEFETHLFALNRSDGSLIRQRLQAAVHALHEVALRPHEQVAANIRDAGIDVLFDLRGWGGGGMPEVLAMRPAPLQVNWLAYPGTSGAPWIDYVIADRFVLPDALAGHFSEQVAHLPRCFQPSDPGREIPAPPSRAACGLPDEGVVFCCFNNSYKLNPATFARAMSVLHGVRGSVLWLLSAPGRGDERLRDAARAVGVDPARLVFMTKQPHADYLARLRHADLFLDSTPYNAHTTASDALWAGCPVLTVPGATFAARVAGSLNHHLGLDEMNAADSAQYIAHAIALGTDPERLRALRARLAALKATSGLFDMDAFALDFGALVRRMIERQRQGLAPAPLASAASG
jgi:predicted O-linked N-acetylglucosamine transferase (SPINDLY family)